MKRLFVRERIRGMGIGKKLAEAVIGQARRSGYTRMRVHTLRSMEAANALYASLGFKRVDRYEYSPLEGAVFMELALA